MEQPGRLITVEGGEGVGKSLFIKSLTLRLQQAGLVVECTREPGGTELGEKIRDVFSYSHENENMSASTELFLVSAARRHHVEHKIIPALKQGQWVLCDRFIDSTSVYQGALGGVPQKWLNAINEHAIEGCEIALTLLLDCPVEVSQARLKGRAMLVDEGISRYDQAQKALHEKIRSGFLQLAQDETKRIIMISAEQSPEAMVDEAFSQLQERFGLKGKGR